MKLLIQLFYLSIIQLRTKKRKIKNNLFAKKWEKKFSRPIFSKMCKKIRLYTLTIYF